MHWSRASASVASGLACAGVVSACSLLYPVGNLEGVGWCAGQDASYRLCSDFDLPGEAVTQGFDLGLVPNGTAGGSFQLDPSSFVSSPHSALGVAAAFPAGGTSGDRLEGTLWQLGPTPPTFRCALQWNPRRLSTVGDDYAHIVALAVYTDAQETDQPLSLNVQIRADGSVVFLESYGSQLTMAYTVAIPIQVTIGSWYAVQMSFTTTGSATTYTVSVGGIQAPVGTLGVPLPGMSHVNLDLGPAYYAGVTTASSPGWTFGYDNVICY
jgi:hypothetical protein